MNQPNEHPDGPWVHRSHRIVVTDGYDLLAKDAEQADRIVKCVNLHDELVEALRRLCSHGIRSHDQIREDWDRARAVLAKA